MKLVEVARFTDDVGALASFYRNLLGREPVASSPGMAIFQVGGTKILLHETYEPGAGELPPEDHLAFAVQDLDAVCEVLLARGLELEEGPRAYDWGRSAYLRDPGGQLIELAEEMESHER
jgi:catechol 2,3-dioxygenase-like lactoylglutathione lyase family enzyme